MQERDGRKTKPNVEEKWHEDKTQYQGKTEESQKPIQRKDGRELKPNKGERWQRVKTLEGKKKVESWGDAKVNC